MPIAAFFLFASFIYAVVELLLRACGYRRAKTWPPVGIDLIALRGEVAEAPVGIPHIPDEFSEKIETVASRLQAAAALEGDWQARGRERGVQVSSQRVTPGLQLMRGEAIGGVPLPAVKDALLATGVSTFNDDIETSTKIKECGPQTFISRIVYRKRMFSSPRECYVLTHWHLLHNGALLVCNQSLTNEDDSVVPPPGTGASRGYVRSTLRLEGWLATQLPRGSDGIPATNLVYVIEGPIQGRGLWGADRLEQSHPLQVSKLIRTLTQDPDMLDRYENTPQLRNEG